MAGNKRSGIKKSTQSLNSRWMRNALKSFGLAGTEIIKEMIPATAETFTSATKLATETARSLRSNKVGAKSIGNALSNNPIIKTGQDFLRYAAEDLKSGKLFNKDRSLMGDDFDFDFDDTDFSFGDMDESDVSEININTNVNNGSSDATLKLMEKQMDYQVKSTKATIDTMVATTSTMLMKTSEIGSAMVSHLESIDSNIAALVQYNSSNMTKFIEASIGFYEQMTGAFKKEESSYGSNRISPDAIFGANGGLDFSTYKDFVKQNIVRMKDESMIGSMVSMVLENKDMLISNPLGGIMKGVMSKLIPDAIKAASNELDKTVQDVIPVLLDRIGRLGDNDNSSFAPISRFISKAFGVKNDRNEVIDYKKVTDGPIPFNGMSHHAIINVIPNYLRESNQYLKVIAEHLTGKDVDMSESKFYDWREQKFSTMKTVEDKTYDTIRNEITDILMDTDFFKALKEQQSRIKNKNNSEGYTKFLEQLAQAAYFQSGEINLADKATLEKLVKEAGGNKSYLNAVLETASRNEIKNSSNNFNSAKFRAVNRGRLFTDELNETGAWGNQFAVTHTLEENTRNNWVKFKDRGRAQSQSSFRRMREAGEGATISGAEIDERNQTGDKTANLIKNFSDIIKSIGTGNADVAWSNFMQGLKKTVTDAGKMITENFLHPIAVGLFGEKDANGFFSKGIFSGVNNRFKESYFKLRRQITGQGYTNVEGKKIEDLDEEATLKGKIKNVTKFMSEQISLRLFGNKDYNYEEDTASNNKGKTKGLFGELRWKLTEGGDSIPEMMKRAGKRFTEFMFGKEIVDDDGNVIGREDNGKISAKTQQWFKEDDRGKFMAGGALIGGFMGLLTGGPILGAAKGIAGALLVKSEAWKNFLFGNPETGDVGLKNHAKNFLRNLSIGKNGDPSATKMTGTLLAGAGTGGLIGMLVGGPVIGAGIGLGATLLAQKDNIKEWLFGSEYEDEEGNKHKKLGVLGKVGNSITANIIHPIGNKVKNIAEDIGVFVKYDVLNPLAIHLGELGERVSLRINKVVHGIGNLFSSIGKSIKENLLNNIIEVGAKILSPIGAAVSTVADAVVAAGKAVVSAPVKLLGAILSPVTKAVSTVVSTAAKVTFGAVDKLLIKPISTLVLKPLGGIVKIAGKVVAAPFEMIGNVVTSVSTKVENAMVHVSNFMFEAGKNIKDAIINSKFVQTLRKGVDHVRNFTEELVSPVIDLAKATVDEVKKTIKNGFKNFFKGIFDAFKTMINPLNWIRAIGKIGGGLAGLILGKERAGKIGDTLSKLNPFRARGEGERRGWFTGIGDLWRRTAPGEYKIDNSARMTFDEQGNVVDSNLSYGEKLANNKQAGINARLEAKKHREERRARTKNEKLIAKYTNNQFVTDTEENRQIAIAAAKKKGVNLSDNNWGNIEAVKSESEKDVHDISRAVALIASHTLGTDMPFGGKKINAEKFVKDDKLRQEQEKEKLEDTLKGSKGILSTLFNSIFGQSKEQKLAASYRRESDRQSIQNIFARKDLGLFGKIKAGWDNIKSKREAGNWARTFLFNKRNFTDEDQANSMMDLFIDNDEIPKYAAGTSNAKPGIAVVGENGPEIVVNKGGEEVINSNRKSGFWSKLFAKFKKNEAHDEEDQAKVSTLTGDAKMAENDAKKKEEEAIAREEAQIKGLEDLKQETKEHNLAWLATFGKKGLIVTGILALLPLAKKFLDKVASSGVIGTVVDIGKKIKGFWTNKVKPWWDNKVVPWWNDEAKPWITEKFTYIKDEVIPKIGSAIQTTAEWLWDKVSIVVKTISESVVNIWNTLKWVKERGALGDGKNSLDKLDDEGKRTARIIKDVTELDPVQAGKDFILNEEGETDHQSYARGKFLAQRIGNAIFSHSKAGRAAEEAALLKYKNVKNPWLQKTLVKNYKGQAGLNEFISKSSSKASPAFEKIKNVGSKIGSKFKSLFNKKAVSSGLDEAGELAQQLVEMGADDVAETGAKVSEKMAQNAAKEANGTVITKLKGAIDDFIKFLAKKLPKATKILSSVKGLFTKLVSNSKVLSKVVPKITTLLTATVGLVATGVGILLKGGTWIALGTVSGATGAKRLFFTDEVDGLMITISTAFGAFLGTTVGSIIDILNEGSVAVTGVDVIAEAASLLYKGLVRLAGDEWKANELTKNQETNKKNYEKYQKEVIGSQYESMKASGKIGANVTKEEYIKGAMDGTYESDYDSYADWNDERHKTVFGKIKEGFGNIKSGVSSVGNKIYNAGLAIGNAEADLISKAGSGISGLWNGAKNGVLGLSNKISSFFGKRGGTRDNGTVAVTPNDPLFIGGNIGGGGGPNAFGAINGPNMLNPAFLGMINQDDKPKSRKTIWTELMNLAKTGDIDKVKNYKGTIDNKSSLAVLDLLNVDVLKKFALPRAYLYAAGKWVKDKIENLKSTGSVLNGQFEKIGELAKAGDVDGLRNFEIGQNENGEDSSLSGFMAGLIGIVRTINMPRAMMHSFGNKVTDAFEKLKEDSGKQVIDYTSQNNNIADLSKEGEFTKMWEINKIGGEGPLKGVFNALLTVSKLVHSPGALIHALGNKISEKFEGFFDKVKKNNETYHKAVDDIMDKGQKSDLKGIWSTTLNTDKGDLLNPFYTVATGISKVISSVVAVVMYLANKAKWLWDKVNPGNWFKDSAAEAIASETGSGSQGSGSRDSGGYGPGMLNGHPYYSQNDPRWANMSYNRSDGIFDGATMGDSGCGPTAMSMILSDIQKGDVSPTTLAKFAQASGTRDETGTNYDFIDKSANAYGVSSRRNYNPTATELTSSLSGSPMVLAGYDDGSGLSPYTDAGHYIVATGVDNYGNIQYSDPRGVEFSGSIDPISLARSTNASWSFGGFGKKNNYNGKVPIRKLTQIMGGRGIDSSVAKTGVTASDVVSIARGEEGYISKNSNANLGQKALGPNQSPGNYNKYNYDVSGPQAVNQEWCAAFVVWCILQASNRNREVARQVICDCPLPSSVGCSNLTDYFDKANRLIDGDTIRGKAKQWLKPGDIVLAKGTKSGYRIPSKHAQLVLEVVDDDHIKVANGNGPGDKVTIYDETLEGRYFGRPRYDNTSAFEGVVISSAGSSGEPSKYDPSLGVTEEEYNIWTYLRSKEGLSPAAVAGIMGNWEVESNNQSRRIEGDYMSGFPGYDTLTHDRSAMDDWTVNRLFPAYANSGIKISKSTYGPHGDGHYYPGIGLAQWTGTRAKALYDFSNQNNKDWSTLDAQLDYFTNGPGEFKYRYPGLRDLLNAAKTPEEAASTFGYKFEGNIGGSESKRKAYATNFYNKLSGVTDDYVPGSSGEGSTIGDKLSSIGSGALGFLGRLGTALSTIGSAMFEDLISGNWKNRNWKETLAAAFAGENGISSDYSSDYYSGDYGYYDSSSTSSDATVNTKASASMSKLWSIAAGYKNSYNSVKTQYESLSENDKKIVKVLADKYIGIKGNKDKLNRFYQEASDYSSIAKTLSNGTAATQFKKSSKYTSLTKDELAFITELLNYGKPNSRNNIAGHTDNHSDRFKTNSVYEGNYNKWVLEYQYHDKLNNYMKLEQMKSQRPEFYKRYKAENTTAIDVFNNLLPNSSGSNVYGPTLADALPGSNKSSTSLLNGGGFGKRGVSKSRIQRYYTGGYGPKNDSVSRKSIRFSSPSSSTSRYANYYGGYGGDNYIIDNKYDQVLSHIDSVLTAIASNTNNLNLLADIKANTASGGRGIQTIIQDNGRPLTRETNSKMTNNIPNNRPQSQGYPATGYLSNNEKTARAIAFGS